MNCETYLSLLSTVSVDELAYGDARAHIATCRDCDRVTRVVAERERNMIIAFGDLYPEAAAGTMASRALVISRRRRIAQYYRIALAVAAAATVFIFIAARRLTPASTNQVSETFRLQCLSPEQAVELLRPFRSPSASMSIRPNSPLGIIRVVASPVEIEQMRAVLDRYDTPTRSQCGVQLTLPKDVSR